MAATHPLIICDVDEVVLHFVAPFEVFLNRQGLQLIKRSYALSGNVIDQASGEALPGDRVGPLVQAFFSEESHAQEAIDGSAEALADLSTHADILFLTNVPSAIRDRRGKRLVEHGMPYPVHVNDGPKGRAAAGLANGRQGPIFFLDDIGQNLRSVGEHVPSATLIQFIGDASFFDLAPEERIVDFKTRDWDQTKAFILSRLDAA